MKFQIIAGELCLDFINTLDNRNVPERLKELVPTFRDLTEWAMQAGALSPAQGRRLLRIAAEHPQQAGAVRERAAELRECLYRIFTAIALRRRVDGSDLRTFNGYLAGAQSKLEVQPAANGFRLEWAADVRLDFVLWPIVRSAGELLTSRDLKNVRECGVDICRWLFVDRSKNHSRRWCDMKICGNRIKAQNFYRKRAGSGRVPEAKGKSR